MAARFGAVSGTRRNSAAAAAAFLPEDKPSSVAQTAHCVRIIFCMVQSLGGSPAMQKFNASRRRLNASALQPLLNSSTCDFWTHVAVAAASVRLRTSKASPYIYRTQQWPGPAGPGILGVARPPPLVDRLLRADSICFLLVCMTIGTPSRRSTGSSRPARRHENFLLLAAAAAIPLPEKRPTPSSARPSRASPSPAALADLGASQWYAASRVAGCRRRRGPGRI